jgi:NAD+ diphosphatase
MSAKSYIRFTPGVALPELRRDNDLWFVYCNNKLLVKSKDENLTVLCWRDIKDLNFEFIRTHYLGSLGDIHCYCAEAIVNSTASAGLEFSELRAASAYLEDDMFMIAGKALQVIHWDQTHQFCGRCGNKTQTVPGERAKECPDCGLINYPRISPAIIVAVTNGDKILLAHNKRFINNMHSVIAGFVEPGENFEECVRREVYEEVGIQVKNIRYFGSQPWPFPNSLMIGFTAEYEGGDIKVDGVEIDSANWFCADKLPNIPSRVSIAGKLIASFLESFHKAP